MVKPLCAFLGLLLCTCCAKKAPVTPVPNSSSIVVPLPGQDKKQDTTTVWLTYFKDSDTLPKLVPAAITETQFNQYTRNYHLQIDSTRNRITTTPREITINTAVRDIHFKADTTDYQWFAYYKGYLPQLKAYLVDDVNAGNEISSLFLIDSLTGKKYVLESTFDNSCELPLPSLGLASLLAYANDNYAQYGSFISIIDIHKNGRVKYSVRTGYTFENHKIERAAWINDTAFAIKLVPQDTNDTSPAQFYTIQVKP